MGCVYLLVGAGNLIAFPGGGPDDKWVRLGLGVCALLVGIGYLTTAIALRRYQRSP
jgi:hypothetical protein